MKQPIYKVDRSICDIQNRFYVLGEVKAVYDENDTGTLLPVEFAQINVNTVQLKNQPYGQLYYQIKKPTK